MLVTNLIGVLGAMIAAMLAWVPVYVFDGDIAEYMAGLVFFASAYASWTDRYAAEDADKAYSDFLDFTKHPVGRVAVFGVPLLISPLVALIAVTGIMCFNDFARAGYLIPLYLGVCVAAGVIAVVTAGRRLVLTPEEFRRRLGEKPSG